MKHSIIFLFALVASLYGMAADISSNGTGGGDWDQTTTWAGGVVPGDGDNITIVAGDVVEIDGTPDVTLNDVTITIDGELNMDNDGFDTGNLNLTGSSGLLVSSTGSITESVGAFQEGFTTISLNGVILWTACSNPVCVGIVNGILDPDPEANGGTTGGSGGLLLPGAGNPLPVEFIFFTAKYENQNVILEWATAWEENNSHFEIERSFDAENFEFLGVADGSGNSSERIDYSYIDPEVQSLNREYIFYRLKQIDFDGMYDYSNAVVAVSEDMDPFSIQVRPNPFKESFTLSFNSIQDESVQFVIFDLAGREIHREERQVFEGTNDLKIQGLGSMTPGNYVYRIQGSSFSRQGKLIKTR